ncbi:MAG: hemolysin family protein [Candidatus Binataceae bacterium]
MTLAVLIGALLACLVAQMFFSASEVAVVSADELKIKAAAHLGEKSAALLNWLLERRDRLLAAILTGTNLATVIAAAVLTSFFHESMPRREFIAPFILAPLSLLVGESLPKLLTLKRPLAFAIFAVRPLRVLTLVLAPLLTVETWLGRGVRRLFGVAPGHEDAFISREDLALLMHRHGREAETAGDAILPAERFMISRIFRFTRSEARKAMVPLVRVDAVPTNLSQAETVEVVRREGFSRLPVYEGKILNIVGVVHVFDLLEAPDLSRPVSEIMRPVSYFAESTPLDEILVALQRTGENMAVVVDEYGGAAGIITVEDLLEEVVGEIEDEYDEREELARIIDSRTLAVSARATLSDLNERFGLRLPEGDGYATIGGLVVESLGHIPKPGEQLSVADVTIRVTRADARAVRDLLLIMDRPLRMEQSRQP